MELPSSLERHIICMPKHIHPRWCLSSKTRSLSPTTLKLNSGYFLHSRVKVPDTGSTNFEQVCKSLFLSYSFSPPKPTCFNMFKDRTNITYTNVNYTYHNFNFRFLYSANAVAGKNLYIHQRFLNLIILKHQVSL